MKKYRHILNLIAVTTCVAMNAQVTVTQIGQSKYDLQTNNSIERRIVVDPVSKNLTVTYTGSNSTDGTFDDRGTGYAFFDGTAWKNQAGATLTTPVTTFPTRPESVRIGWPNPIYVGNKEIIVSHQSTGASNGLWIASRANKGTGTWTQNSLTTGAETWPRAAQDGNNIVVISSVFQTTYNEVDGGIMIIKSTDGGVTWSNPDSITGINIGNYPGGLGGDLYAVDLKGSTVAILTGQYDVTLYKSTNLGSTFTKTSLIPTYHNYAAKNSLDLPAADRADGSYSVLIDNSNKVHCFWGRNSTFSGVDASGAYGIFIDRFKAGIMYWNEDMGVAKAPVVIPQTAFIRENANAPITISERFNTVAVDGTAITYVGNGSGYSNNVVSWPSSGIDATGTIYLTYAYNRGIIDTTNKGVGKDADSKGANLYDIYVVKTSNGVDWKGPLNISNTATGESSYPSMARYVDDYVHVVWQEDNLYGNAISTTTGGGNGTGSQVGTYTDNKMMYGKVPVADIINPATDITPPVLQFRSGVDQTSVTNDSVIISIFKGCNKDNITNKSIVLTKQYFLDNFLDFFDDVDGRDTSKVTFSDFSTVDLNTPGIYTVKVWGVDAMGNKTTRGRIISTTGVVLSNTSLDTARILFEVLAASTDTEAPTLELYGDNPAFVYLGTSYTDPGASVSDNNPCASNNFTKSGSVNTTTAGTYTLTYEASDLAANKTTKTRVVNVGKEPTPVISGESITINKATASSSTSQNIEPFTSPVFTWYGKVAGGAQFVLTTGATLNAYTLTKKMDSLCLEAKNVFNSSPFDKPKKTTCVELKYTGAAVQNINGQSFSINLYPNPNSGKFNLKFEGLNKTGVANIIIANTEGKVVNKMTVDLKGNDEIPFDMSSYSKGNYIINTEIQDVNFINRFEIK